MDFDSFLEVKLVNDGLLNQEKLDVVKQHVNENNPLSDLLVTQKFIEEDLILQHLTNFYGIPSINLNFYHIDQEILDIIPSALAQKFRILPLFRIRNVLLLAMANPSDIHVMDEIRIKTSFGVEPVIVLPSSVKAAISWRMPSTRNLTINFFSSGLI